MKIAPAHTLLCGQLTWALDRVWVSLLSLLPEHSVRAELWALVISDKPKRSVCQDAISMETTVFSEESASSVVDKAVTGWYAASVLESMDSLKSFASHYFTGTDFTLSETNSSDKGLWCCY